MTIKFGVETIEGIMIEGAAHFVKHHFEAGLKEERPNPDFKAFLDAEDVGAVRVFTARNMGVLIGYAIFWIQKSTQYDGVQAVLELLYITPKERGFGPRFILWCEGQLKRMKVKRVFQSLPISRNFAPLMKRLGYEAVEINYTKKL
jgi:hypothetical protein